MHRHDKSLCCSTPLRTSLHFGIFLFAVATNTYTFPITKSRFLIFLKSFVTRSIIVSGLPIPVYYIHTYQPTYIYIDIYIHTLHAYITYIHNIHTVYVYITYTHCIHTQLYTYIHTYKGSISLSQTLSCGTSHVYTNIHKHLFYSEIYEDVI